MNRLLYVVVAVGLVACAPNAVMTAGDDGVGDLVVVAEPTVDEAPIPTAYPVGDACGIVARYTDGAYRYRCAAGTRPTTFDGHGLECTVVAEDDGHGESLLRCEAGCVRFAPGDGNCTTTGGAWYVCPSGDAVDYRSIVGAPDSTCRFFTGGDMTEGGRTSGYCCDPTAAPL